jgi:hypothetical protein
MGRRDEKMPIALNWYGCEYQCGFKSTDWEEVKEHESNCIENPNNPYCGYCGEIRGDGFLGEKTCRKYNRSIYTCGVNHWNAGKCKECIEAQRKRIDGGESK